MQVSVNGIRLWFDVEGPGLVPDGEGMRQRPTLVLLHGGPGFDHATFKPAFGALADTAQVVYLDHRGQGRSGGEDRSTWTLAQWADDVRAFCDALGIEKPVVLGNSFGGFVAQEYLRRHPDHAAGVILSSTAARMCPDLIAAAFERRGGPAVRDAAMDFWNDVRAEKVEAFSRTCMPYYTAQQPADGVPGRRRSLQKPEVLEHFSGRGGEMWQMDFRDSLRGTRVPVLVLAGDLDPITPWECAEELVAHLPPHLTTYHRVPHCGHGLWRDDPDGCFAVIRSFLDKVA